MSTSAFCQQNDAPADIIATRYMGVLDNYQKADITSIITGRRYTAIYDGADKNRFFKSKDPTIGTVIYDNIIVEDIEIQYDLVDQQIVVLLETRKTQE